MRQEIETLIEAKELELTLLKTIGDTWTPDSYNFVVNELRRVRIIAMPRDTLIEALNILRDIEGAEKLVETIEHEVFK